MAKAATRSPRPDRPIRVLLANDSELVVEGLKAMLAPFADRVDVVASAVGDPEILIEASTPDADVMLIDAFSRVGAGLDAAAMVLAQRPHMNVVVYTEVHDLARLFAALRLGVKGYLLKSGSTSDLVEDLERVASGEMVIDRSLATDAAMLAARTTRADWPGFHLGLSRRESDVLRLLAQGTTVAAIADALGVGYETVRTHLRQVYRKLGVNDRAAAVAVAWREGLGS